MAKITKKKRKAANGPNAAVLRSIRDGHQTGDYIGDEPYYRNVNLVVCAPPDWRKVSPGVPYVNRHRWRKAVAAAG